MEENQEQVAENKPAKPESKWKGYKPQKGVTPPWNPFDPAKRKKRMTFNERKFLAILSTTGKLNEAFRGVYKVKNYPDKRVENARVQAMANQVLARLRRKFPELVEQMMFEDITPEFVRKEMMKIYKNEGATVGEKTRILELMGKIHGMFTDKQVVESSVKQIVGDVYKEVADDFPDKDERIDRVSLNDKIATG